MPNLRKKKQKEQEVLKKMLNKKNLPEKNLRKNLEKNQRKNLSLKKELPKKNLKRNLLKNLKNKVFKNIMNSLYPIPHRTCTSSTNKTTKTRHCI